MPTIYNRLQDKGVDWVYYYGSIAVAAALGNPGPYQLDLGANDGKTGKIRKFAAYPDDAGDPNGQFFKDCAAGKLPPVTYIDPFFGNGGNDDHPPTHPIMAQSLIAAVYTALAKSPLWKHCMLVITYDEHGGFFDHVPPPMTTDDTLQKFGVDGFQQMGFRVPALVIGPYVKQGYVSSRAVRPLLRAQGAPGRVRPRSAQRPHGHGERSVGLHRHGPARQGRLGAAGRDPDDQHR